MGPGDEASLFLLVLARICFLSCLLYLASEQVFVRYICAKQDIRHVNPLGKSQCYRSASKYLGLAFGTSSASGPSHGMVLCPA